MRFIMEGQMPEWLQAKDLILQIIGEISVSGATYKVRMAGFDLVHLTLYSHVMRRAAFWVLFE